MGTQIQDHSHNLHADVLPASFGQSNISHSTYTGTILQADAQHLYVPLSHQPQCKEATQSRSNCACQSWDSNTHSLISWFVLLVEVLILESWVQFHNQYVPNLAQLPENEALLHWHHSAMQNLWGVPSYHLQHNKNFNSMKWSIICWIHVLLSHSPTKNDGS